MHNIKYYYVQTPFNYIKVPAMLHRIGTEPQSSDTD